MSPAIKINSFNKNKEYYELKSGRSCYCHLAGEIAVDFFDFLVQMNYLVLGDDQVVLTTAAQKSTGLFVKPC